MKIISIINYLKEKYPVSLQESYDNTGVQLLFADSEVTNVLIALDLDNSVVNDAIDNGCNLIITHHPFFFKEIKKIDFSDPHNEILLKLIENKITVFAMHTNLDKVFYDKLGKEFNIKKSKVLFEEPNKSFDFSYGTGSYGELLDEVSLNDLLLYTKQTLNLEYVVYVGDKNKKINKIAFINGSGGSFISRVCQTHKVDCIVTGDVTYHYAKSALEYEVAIIDGSHFGTEKIFLKFIKKEVEEFLINKGLINNLQVYIAKNEKNPFQIYL